MKKNIFSLGVLAAAAIALAGCAKTETNVPEVRGAGIPFEFTATSALTKTTNDTEATNWEAGDKVNLFHAELGGTAIKYVSDGAFTAATDGAEVKFTGTLAEGFDPEGTYNWYALYPYTSQVTTPANHNKGWVTVGSGANSSQTQKGNGNMNHIAGSNYPIAGVAQNIPGEEKLRIEMTHLTSLIEVSVMNNTIGPITVTEVSFTGTEDIVGTYYVDFANSPIKFTSSGDTYVSKTARLTVSESTAIQASKAEDFYLAVKPFSAKTGDKLTVKVNTKEHGVFETEKTLESDVEFKAGVVNHIMFNYNKADDITYDKIADLKNKSANDDANVQGQVTAFCTSGFVVTDATGSIFVWTKTNDSSSLSIGQTVTVSGVIGFFNKCIQIASPSVTAVATGSYSYPNPETFGLEEVTAYNADEANRLASYVTYTGRLVKSGNFWNLLIGSGTTTANGTLYNQIQDMSNFDEGDMVVVTGYAFNVMSGRCAVIPTDIQLKVVPKLTYNPVPDVAADGITNGTLPVTISNAEGWTTGITYDGEVVTAASLNSNEIAYTVSKNTGTIARTGTIGVTFSKSGEEDVVYSISIAQLAEAAAGTKTFTLTGTNMSNMTGGNGYGDVKSGTFDGFTWTSNGYRTADIQNMLQIRVRTNKNGVSYIQLPTFPGNIQSVSMKVTTSDSSEYTTDTCNATLAIQAGTTSTETVLVSGQVSNNQLTLDLSSKEVKTGYIVSTSFSARIWEVTVVYNEE